MNEEGRKKCKFVGREWVEVKKNPLVKMAVGSLTGWLPTEDQPGPSHQQAGTAAEIYAAQLWPFHLPSLRTNHTHLKNGQLRLKVKSVAKATLLNWQPRSEWPTTLWNRRSHFATAQISALFINSRSVVREEAPRTRPIPHYQAQECRASTRSHRGLELECLSLNPCSVSLSITYE